MPTSIDASATLNTHTNPELRGVDKVDDSAETNAIHRVSDGAGDDERQPQQT